MSAEIEHGRSQRLWVEASDAIVAEMLNGWSRLVRVRAELRDGGELAMQMLDVAAAANPGDNELHELLGEEVIVVPQGMLRAMIVDLLAQRKLNREQGRQIRRWIEDAPR